MKPEPLKDKMNKYHAIYDSGLHPFCKICAIESDVKSACEWYHDKLKFLFREFFNSRLTHYQFKNKVYALRKEAFEDVFKG